MASKAEWVVYDYEVRMFRETLNLCGGNTLPFERTVTNAIVESMLLHTRNLADILLDRDARSDAVQLKNLLPGFVPSRRADLKRIYGAPDIKDSPCWTINKRLVHSITVRTEGFDYGPTMLDLSPDLHSIITEVQTERLKRQAAEQQPAPAPESVPAAAPERAP